MKWKIDAIISLQGIKKFPKGMSNGIHLEFKTKKEAIKILQKIGYPKGE